MIKVVACPACGNTLSVTADTCPNCGHKVPPGGMHELIDKRERSDKRVKRGCSITLIIIAVCIGALVMYNNYLNVKIAQVRKQAGWCNLCTRPAYYVNGDIRLCELHFFR